MNPSAMDLKLAEWVLRVEAGHPLLPPPVWTLDEVRIGPAPRDPDYDAHIARTTGSSVVWGDEWRFDPDDGRLVSLIWRVPETNAASPGEMGGATPAALFLTSAAGEVDMPEVRSFTPERLVCGRRDDLVRPLGLTIAPGLTLLTQDGRWWGWALEDPMRHLPGGPAPAELAELVRGWTQLVSDDTLDALGDADPTLEKDLRALAARARTLGHPAADLLADRIEAVLGNFYGD